MLVRTFNCLLCAITLLALPQLAQSEASCVSPNQWINPASGEQRSVDDVIQEVAGKRVVLLGEHHGNAAHHRWQRDVLDRLYSHRPKLSVALEMLPRDKNFVVEGYISKKLSLDQFVKQSEWDVYWSYPIELYTPVLEWLQQRSIPTEAVNIDRQWLDDVSARGLDQARAAKDPAPIDNPAKPNRAYLTTLAHSFRRHRLPATDEAGKAEEREKFKRFVDVQLAWDKVLADGVKKMLDAEQNLPIVLLAGTWHVVNRHGVVLQLHAMGIEDVAVLVPWDEHIDCAELNADFADAIYFPVDGP